MIKTYNEAVALFDECVSGKEQKPVCPYCGAKYWHTESDFMHSRWAVWECRGALTLDSPTKWFFMDRGSRCYEREIEQLKDTIDFLQKTTGSLNQEQWR